MSGLRWAVGRRQQSKLARQMRAIIEQKVQAGETEAQILAYFVERMARRSSLTRRSRASP